MFSLQCSWTTIALLILFESVGSWILAAYVITYTSIIDFEFYFVWWRLLREPAFYLVLLVTVVLVMLIEVTESVGQRFWSHSPVKILQEVSCVFMMLKCNVMALRFI